MGSGHPCWGREACRALSKVPVPLGLWRPCPVKAFLFLPAPAACFAWSRLFLPAVNVPGPWSP